MKKLRVPADVLDARWSSDWVALLTTFGGLEGPVRRVISPVAADDDQLGEAIVVARVQRRRRD